MIIYKFSVQKKELEAFPENELTFFVQACRMLNEINTLHKITIFSNKEVGTEIERKAQNSQSLFLLTILTGKLWEGWELLEKAYFGSKLSKTYQDLLPNDAKNTLDSLKKYFGKSDNLIKKVREKIAFHYDSVEILEQIRKTPQNEAFEIYLSENQGNSFYYISSVLLINAILEWTGIPDPLEAIDKFFTEVLNVARWFIEFLNRCLETVARINIHWEFQKVEIPNPAQITDVAIPYFVDRPLSKTGKET